MRVELRASVWLLLLFLGCSVANFGRHECNDVSLNSSCQCRTSLSDYEIFCPDNIYNPKFKLTLAFTTSNVQIECNVTDASEYIMLPQLSIGNITRVQIQRCPLPFHTPIAGILDHLGIRNPQMLIFESDNLGPNLTRKHLDRLQNLKRLRFSSRTLKYLPVDFLHDLRNLIWLDLRFHIEELPAQLFANLENLELLELGNNHLKQLPHGFFRNLHRLRHLNLWSNQLHNLTRHQFEGAFRLADVDLSSNGIEQLPSDVFAPLTNLSEINLNGNRFRSLPAGLFEHNKNLTRIRLLNNRVPLPELPPGLFANLPKLQILSVLCDLETLPDDLFENSSQLTNLTLMGNLLNTLPAKLLEHQTNLLNLNLRHNRLSRLPEGIFQETTKLVYLNLAENHLTEINAELFSKLAALESLVMHNNHIHTIDQFAFVGPTNLQHIDLANNRIEFVKPKEETKDSWLAESGTPFAQTPKLQTLNLRNNSIKFVFKDWQYNLLSLRELDLSYNNISRLDYTDLEFLRSPPIEKFVLNMRHNQIRSLTFYETLQVGESSSLVQVDLNDNPLICDCTVLRFIQLVRGEIKPEYANNLELRTDELKCAGPNGLTDRPVRFVKPHELLCKFDQSTNPRERRCPLGCDCTVRAADKALIINCSHGNLTKVPKLPRLNKDLLIMELHLENNTLLKLPPATTPGYENVTSLNLAGNNLTHVDITQLPTNLRELDLSGNRLHWLNYTVLNFLNATMPANSLRLSGNPWICNCDAKELLTFTQNNYRQIIDRSSMLCINAEVPTPMQDLKLSDICPERRGLVIALAIIIALAGFLTGITAALYYKYQQEIKIWMYAHNICLWFVTEEELDKDKLFDAFVSYSHKDQSFIEQYLVPQLEHGPLKFKLCVAERDWQVGCTIPENIVRSVDDSRRTIIVMSENFIKSEWSRLEFKAAHKSALNEGRARVIVIIYSDIGDVEKLDHELKAYLKMNTYLKWGDPWFWDKLHYAMPHRMHHRQQPRQQHSNVGNGALVKSALKGSTDDKLELIKPSPVTPPLTTPPAEATKNPLVAHLNGGTPPTAIMIANGKNGLTNLYTPNGKSHGNGHINGAFIINTNAKQSDV